MKPYLTSLILAFMCQALLAQHSRITGTVTDQEGNALSDVHVSVQHTGLGGQTNGEGSFDISGIPAGTHRVTLSFLGYRSREITVTLQAGGQLDMETIVLYEGNEILQEVVVSADRVNKFSRKQTAYVAKMTLRDIENTQVYSTITTELLQSQAVVSFDDALRNATGVEKLWASTGRGGDGAGYYALRGFSVQPQLVNGLPGLTNGTINPANIERIEVMKGPSATLFGNAVSSYGGLINVVTKKPYAGFGGEASFTTGTYGLNQVTADFNTPLSEENQIYFRLNTAYTTQQSFQDAGFRTSFFVAPSLSYKVNNRLSFSFYGEITKAEQTNPTFLFLNRSAPTAARNLEQLGYNNKLSFTSNDLSLKNPTENYRVEMDYKLSDAWQSQTLVSRSSTSTTGYYSYLFDFGILGDDVYTRFLNKQNANTQTTDIQQNFIGDFLLAGLRNRVVVGLDYFTATQTDNSTGYAFYGNITPDGGSSGDDPFTPEVEDTPYPLSSAAVDAVLATQPVGNNKSKYHISSLYISDVLNITETFFAMGGLRIDRFDNEGDLAVDSDDYHQTTLSPKFGLVYQPIKDQLSVFANYQNGFTNVAPQLVGDPNQGAQTLKTFDPEQANQLEGGIKTNLFNNRLDATLSYYHIKVTDRVITDPGSPFNKIQGGEVVSKGWEMELSANPYAGLNVRAGFSYNDSETTKSDNAEILNRRPLEAGPKVLYNFWATYEVQEGVLDGLGWGLGFNGAGERFAINYASTGEFVLPAYTLVDASVYYGSGKYRLGLKLNNALNKEYYKGWSTINPQMPRALLANFTYSF